LGVGLVFPSSVLASSSPSVLASSSPSVLASSSPSVLASSSPSVLASSSPSEARSLGAAWVGRLVWVLVQAWMVQVEVGQMVLEVGAGRVVC
jgi:hypothetical protein